MLPARLVTPSLPLALAVALALSLSACPNLPSSSVGGDADASDGDGGDVFVPLSLDRVVESVGSPDGGERVAVFGAGFLPNAEVRFGFHAATNVLVLDSGRLNVDVPPGAHGLVNVTVFLPDGQAATLTDAYLYRGPLAISAIVPDRGPVAGQIPVTVRGEGFTDATVVFVGDRAIEDLELRDATTLVGTLPARLASDAGTVDVVVTDGFEQRALAGGFRYVGALRLDWLSPPSGAAAGGTELTLYGRGLEHDAQVTINGVATEVLVPGHGEAITVRTPPGAVGPADVAVTNALDGLAAPRAFTYLGDAAPGASLALVNAWPAVGTTRGGTQLALTVTGLNDSAGVTVTVGAADATVLEVRPAEHLIVVATPEGDAGPATVAIGAPAGNAARADLFRYARQFEAGAVDPVRGSVAGGTTVRVNGTGFTEATVVRIGGRVAQVTKVGAGFIEVVTPPGSPGRVDVALSDGEQRATLAAAYAYESDERGRLLAITPGEGARSGGRVVRIHGEGLRGGAPAIYFGTELATRLTVVDDALILVRDPRGEVGQVNVSDPRLGRIAMAYRYFNPAQRYGGTAGGPIPEALNVSVLDLVTGQGVDQAFVILWDDLGTPYQGVTDERGQITFSDVGFGPLQMATASKDQYTTASVVDFDARDVTLQLIPMVSSPPGGGGGGGGPQPLSDSTLAGKVSGLDKYVLPPPGSCDNRLIVTGPTGLLCQPCLSDTDCGGAGALCTDLGEQGLRCTSACATDAECPIGYACKGVPGGVQCLPSPGQRTARCSVTQPDVFSSPSGPSFLTATNDQGLYSLTSRPGEYAVVCLGGYVDELSAFIPTMMGVRRHVFAVPGAVVAQQDVVLDIPLNRTLRVRLDDAPIGDEETALHTVDVFVDFGADGIYHMPSSGRERDRNVFTLTHFPARFAESLYDASYTIYASAVPDLPAEYQTGDGSFVLYDAITEVDDDTVLQLDADGVVNTRTGITSDVHALAGAADERMWAVSDGGKVLAFDGTLWGLGQAPTQAALRAVWARDAVDVWAAGDAGAVVRWDGLRWRAVAMPVGFEQVAWRGVVGVGDGVWLWGDAGVWAHDGVAARSVTVDVTAAAVRAVWQDPSGAVWLAGEGGLLRRWREGVTETFDAPGADLNALWGTAADDVWAVGDAGRVWHWNGSVGFDYLPVTTRALSAVHATAPDAAWAVGDAGVVLRWNGSAWRVQATVEHTDLRGVWTTASGRTLAAGLHTLVIGPFLRVPRPVNPTREGLLRGLNLSWSLAAGPDASFTWIELQHSSGFPFWSIMADGARRSLRLPDLKAAWGLEALWPGADLFQIVRAYVPDFTMDAYDNTLQTVYAWRSWVVASWALTIEDPDL